MKVVSQLVCIDEEGKSGSYNTFFGRSSERLSTACLRSLLLRCFFGEGEELVCMCGEGRGEGMYYHVHVHERVR